MIRSSFAILSILFTGEKDELPTNQKWPSYSPCFPFDLMTFLGVHFHSLVIDVFDFLSSRETDVPEYNVSHLANEDHSAI